MDKLMSYKLHPKYEATKNQVDSTVFIINRV